MSLFGWEDEFPTFHRVVYLPGFSEPSKKNDIIQNPYMPTSKGEIPKEKKEKWFSYKVGGPVAPTSYT